MVVFREDLRGDWIRVAEERVVAFQCQRVLSAIVLWGNRLELLQRNPPIHLVLQPILRTVLRHPHRLVLPIMQISVKIDG